MRTRLRCWVLVCSLALGGVFTAQAELPKLTGSWRVEIRFSGGENRAVGFEARAEGKGTLVPLVPAPNQAGPAETPAAVWSSDDKGVVTISGPVTFPLGNIGLLRGTLVLKGTLQPNGAIGGAANFFPADQAPAKAEPTKTGTFSATRTGE